MLKLTTLNESLLVAQGVLEDCSFRARENTPLAAMMSESANGNALVIEDEAAFASTVVSNSMFLAEGSKSSLHDDLVDQFSELGSKAVESVMKTVTNHILPTIEYCGDKISEEVNEWINVSEIPCEIYYIRTPEILRAAGMMELIEANAKKNTSFPVEKADVMAMIGRITDEPSLLDNTETGYVELNAQLKEYVAALMDDDSARLEALRRVFAVDLAPILPTDYRTVTSRINDTMARLALSFTLMNTPPSNLNMGYQQYQSVMEVMRNTACQSLLSLARILKSYQIKRTLIVRSSVTPDKQYEIAVFDPMMKELTEQYGAGSNIVLGAVIQGGLSNIDTIVANKDTCERVGKNALNMFRMRREQKVNDHTRKLLLKYMLEELKGFDEESLTQPKSEIEKALRERALIDTDITIGNVYDYACNWLVDCVYSNDNIKSILQSRMSARELKSDITSSEANYHAIVDLVCEFVAQQIVIAK